MAVDIDRSRVIAGFPRDGIDYNEMLYAGLEARGYRVIQGNFAGGWLIQHAKEIGYCHFHWPSFEYYDPKEGTLRQGVMFLRFVAIVVLIRLLGIRILWTAHNLYPHDGGRHLLRHRLARQLVVLVSQAIFVHGPAAQGIVTREFPLARGKTWPIFHGNWMDYYPADTTVAEARQFLKIPPDRYVYLFFGLCKEYKNLEMLIEAFGSADSRSILVIAGKFQNPVYEVKIRDMLEPLGDRARFFPRFIDKREIQYFMTASDCVVLAYREVLTSGAGILALSYGRPVIAPKKGALVDVVPPFAGTLFSPYTVESLSAAMNSTRLTDFDGDRIRAHARSFDWADTARVMDEVLQGARRTPARS